MSGTEEQLVHFFAYSIFVYPITNWLASPRRGWSRFYGALLAATFLGIHSNYYYNDVITIIINRYNCYSTYDV